MPKNKKPARKAPPPPAPDRTDELIEDLAVLAAEVVEEAGTSTRLQKMDELQKMVRNALRKKQDEVLYGAIEHASYDNPGAYVLLRGAIEEAAAAIVLRAENKPAEEIDAFLVPVFVNSVGGVRRAETFADPAGFELLRASFQAAGLESAAATVVLISHLYDIDEIDALSYCEVNDMLREVAATMGGKSAPMPILERSIAADETPHAPGDEVTELRFLLGFVRRRVDDPAYAIPDDEAGSEAWFDARMDKYRAWTAMADGLLRACISADPARVTLNFLFQNQFFAAKRQAMAEAELLSLMAELGELFDEHALEPEQCSAVVGPVAREADIALRVAIYRNGDAAPLASVELPYDLGDDLDEEIEALCDILHNLGMASLSTADGFGADGQPEQLAPWTAE
jgi:hypothetical protein